MKFETLKARFVRWLKKGSLMMLRAIVWRADEWIQRQEVKLREDLSGAPRELRTKCPRGRVGSNPTPRSNHETFQEWEARISGVTVITKKEARCRRGLTAAEFDRRFA